MNGFTVTIKHSEKIVALVILLNALFTGAVLFVFLGDRFYFGVAGEVN